MDRSLIIMILVFVILHDISLYWAATTGDWGVFLGVNATALILGKAMYDMR
nr:hypothetical protein [Bacteroides intestinalis]